jgi:hypothetical protein
VLYKCGAYLLAKGEPLLIDDGELLDDSSPVLAHVMELLHRFPKLLLELTALLRDLRELAGRLSYQQSCIGFATEEALQTFLLAHSLTSHHLSH